MKLKQFRKRRGKSPPDHSGRGKFRLKSRAGTTLVELVVSMLILGIILNMIVGILSPAAKLFLRMERLQRAEVILDNTVLELYAVAENASGYVKIYDTSAGSPPGDNPAGRAGAASGGMLEFVYQETYTALVSADGCPATRIVMGNGAELGEPAKEVAGGRLLTRYYANESGTGYCSLDVSGNPVARAVANVFPDGYYMGNELAVRFYYSEPGGTAPADGEEVTRIFADVSLYPVGADGSRAAEPLVQEKGIVLNLRYAAVRKDGVTARQDPGP